jgi:hypothetical protein
MYLSVIFFINKRVGNEEIIFFKELLKSYYFVHAKQITRL